MTIVMGLDQRRAQVTAEWIDTETGELIRARVVPAHREGVRRFLSRFAGRELEVALEATTGWRFVVEELRGIGARVHLAEPVETVERRGRKKRPKTDRADARLLRELVMVGRLPESWIAPDHLLDLRALVRLRHALVNERGEWQQRIQAVLYHHGLPPRRELLTRESRSWVEELLLPAPAQVNVALAMIDAVAVELTAVVVLAELGDARCFSSSRDAVRYAGMDITVYQSDQRRAPGHLSRQGPPALRWALFEAAQTARRTGSPDHDYYLPHPARTRRRGTHTPDRTDPNSKARRRLPPRVLPVAQRDSALSVTRGLKCLRVRNVLGTPGRLDCYARCRGRCSAPGSPGAV